MVGQGKTFQFLLVDQNTLGNLLEFDLLAGFNTESAMIIEIKYRPFYWAFKLSENFPLQAERTDNGTWVWKAK